MDSRLPNQQNFVKEGKRMAARIWVKIDLEVLGARLPKLELEFGAAK